MTENQRVKFFRESLGHNQKNFADILEMQPGSLSDVERGKVGISSKIQKKLVLEFYLNPIWLETGHGDMTYPAKYIATDLTDYGKRNFPFLPEEDLKVFSDLTNIDFEQVKKWNNGKDIPDRDASRLLVEFYIWKHSSKDQRPSKIYIDNSSGIKSLVYERQKKNPEEIRDGNPKPIANQKPDTSSQRKIYDEAGNFKSTERSQIPIYNFPAAAGGVEIYNDPNDVKIIGHLNIPGAHKNSFALPAYGHSMYPTLANGDLGIVRPIKDPNEIAWGEVYYIEWADYKMYKRLLLADDEDKVILWSDNQEDKIGTRAKYSPITIKKEKIRKLCLVTEILKKPNY